ncbi:J domain-containing protein [Haloarcula amylovorans]|uniref:J domain-containing protein n=1 Tax=Haloarcula amylovorans TaxID=2562280 RepID=UPI001075FCE9|nr:J domain-containing protein [Halomicroarcula amylolytica]
MPSKVDRTGGEIDWPHWASRTTRRESTHKYSTTLAKSISHIETELEDRLGVDDWRLSTAAPHRKKDGRPYANASPNDPGAVVRWSMDGEQYCVAADQYDDLRDNVRTIGLYIKEKRKMSNRPVHTGQDEFATAQLPSGDEDVIVAGDGGATASTQAPHEVLGVAEDAPDDVVEAVARRLSANNHPDNDGDDAEFKRIQQAKEALLDD